jgi:SAM-dependent methyltransferase
MLKKTLKYLLPTRVRQAMRRVQTRIFGSENAYKGMSNSDIFDSIYRNGVWGSTEDGLSTSGSGSHDVEIVGPYVKQIGQLLSTLKPETIVDLGCGDFNVGHHFAGMAQKYLARDVSSVITERNKERFAHLQNVEFATLDLSNGNLPKADVALVRQVLQHLSNDDVKAFVEYINQHKPFKYLIVTEHLPLPSGFKANLDKPSGPNIRIGINSGIILDQPPFNLQSVRFQQILEVPESSGGIDAKISSTMYEF